MYPITRYVLVKIKHGSLFFRRNAELKKTRPEHAAISRKNRISLPQMVIYKYRRKITELF